jgi:crossover junction endodeoxyribonuclease RuvC
VIKTENKSIIGVGIDQGVANCGFSVVKLREDNELEVLVSGTIVTKSDYPLPQRMLILFNEISKLVEEYQSDIIGCEKLFFNPNQKDGKKKGGRNKSASIVYTNMATGLLYLIAGQKNVPLKEFVPGTVKKALTGNGRAEKEAVEEAVIEAVLNSKIEISSETLKTSHESDAIAIGITAVKHFKDHKEEVLSENKHKKPRKRKGVK